MANYWENPIFLSERRRSAALTEYARLLELDRPRHPLLTEMPVSIILPSLYLSTVEPTLFYSEKDKLERSQVKYLH